MTIIIQMMLVYKDPDGETAFEKSHTGTSLDKQARKVLSTSATDTDLMSKVTTLQKLLKERDDKIAKLETEITMMKVYRYSMISCICIMYVWPILHILC